LQYSHFAGEFGNTILPGFPEVLLSLNAIKNRKKRPSFDANSNETFKTRLANAFFQLEY
jgi:hypothetical protein